eukprot:TRINITY_DN1580_c0_g1_i1.p1 TRINITY_DN1580_c0_g1~~TRINITY_DN1580_c0_g1_i1.p1  ORF type:complete len:692 (-),score=138.02 TRINITY_DN1580_c0_g1_i1:66-2141(-)
MSDQQDLIEQTTDNSTGITIASGITTPIQEDGSSSGIFYTDNIEQPNRELADNSIISDEGSTDIDISDPVLDDSINSVKVYTHSSSSSEEANMIYDIEPTIGDNINCTTEKDIYRPDGVSNNNESTQALNDSSSSDKLNYPILYDSQDDGSSSDIVFTNVIEQQNRELADNSIISEGSTDNGISDPVLDDSIDSVKVNACSSSSSEEENIIHEQDIYRPVGDTNNNESTQVLNDSSSSELDKPNHPSDSNIQAEEIGQSNYDDCTTTTTNSTETSDSLSDSEFQNIIIDTTENTDEERMPNEGTMHKLEEDQKLNNILVDYSPGNMNIECKLHELREPHLSCPRISLLYEYICSILDTIQVTNIISKVLWRLHDEELYLPILRGFQRFIEMNDEYYFNLEEGFNNYVSNEYEIKQRNRKHVCLMRELDDYHIQQAFGNIIYSYVDIAKRINSIYMAMDHIELTFLPEEISYMADLDIEATIMAPLICKKRSMEYLSKIIELTHQSHEDYRMLSETYRESEFIQRIETTPKQLNIWAITHPRQSSRPSVTKFINACENMFDQVYINDAGDNQNADLVFIVKAVHGSKNTQLLGSSDALFSRIPYNSLEPWSSRVYGMILLEGSQAQKHHLRKGNFKRVEEINPHYIYYVQHGKFIDHYTPCLKHFIKDEIIISPEKNEHEHNPSLAPYCTIS